jgi:hypothetical protein
MGSSLRPVRRTNKNTQVILVTAIVAICFLATVWIFRPRQTQVLPEERCSDGPRRLINDTQFATKYWAYSLKVEGTISEKSKASMEIDPKQLQKLSEAMQQANEFRKWLVASYNACAISQAQYATYEMRYQGLDQAARIINETLRSGNSSPNNQARVSAAIRQYTELANSLQFSATKP